MPLYPTDCPPPYEAVMGQRAPSQVHVCIEGCNCTVNALFELKIKYLQQIIIFFSSLLYNYYNYIYIYILVYFYLNYYYSQCVMCFHNFRFKPYFYVFFSDAAIIGLKKC